MPEPIEYYRAKHMGLIPARFVKCKECNKLRGIDKECPCVAL